MLIPRFRFVIVGEGVSIPSAEGGAPVCAFATTRFVRATTEAEARRVALAQVEETWVTEPSSSASPKPRLSVAFSARVVSPLKRSRPNGGYSFVTSPADLPTAVEMEVSVTLPDLAPEN